MVDPWYPFVILREDPPPSAEEVQRRKSELRRAVADMRKMVEALGWQDHDPGDEDPDARKAYIRDLLTRGRETLRGMPFVQSMTAEIDPPIEMVVLKSRSKERS